MPTTTKVKKSTSEGKADATDGRADGLESQLKGAVVAVFGSARAAFDAHSKDGRIGKRGFKKLIKKVLPSLKPNEAKRLRKALPNKMTSLDFCSFIGGPEDTASSTSKANGDKDELSGLASLPPEVPEVCQNVCFFCIHT